MRNQVNAAADTAGIKCYGHHDSLTVVTQKTTQAAGKYWKELLWVQELIFGGKFNNISQENFIKLMLWDIFGFLWWCLAFILTLNCLWSTKPLLLDLTCFLSYTFHPGFVQQCRSWHFAWVSQLGKKKIMPLISVIWAFKSNSWGEVKKKNPVIWFWEVQDKGSNGMRWHDFGWHMPSYSCPHSERGHGFASLREVRDHCPPSTDLIEADQIMRALYRVDLARMFTVANV